MTTTIGRRGAGLHGDVGVFLRALKITGCALAGSLMAQAAFAQTAPEGFPDFASGNEDADPSLSMCSPTTPTRKTATSRC
jgi:hypothetical protein